jgi:hypothetical protein
MTSSPDTEIVERLRARLLRTRYDAFDAAVLDLITRQAAEIERLRSHLANMVRLADPDNTAVGKYLHSTERIRKARAALAESPAGLDRQNPHGAG